MGEWNGFHTEDWLQRQWWLQRRLLTKLSCTSRDTRNENVCGICSWMKRDRKPMLKISRQEVYVKNIALQRHSIFK